MMKQEAQSSLGIGWFTSAMYRKEKMLEIFKQNDFEIRVVGDIENPLFVASDICKALEIINSRDAIKSLQEKKDGVVLTDIIIDTHGVEE